MALLSKYTAVLLAGSTFLALVSAAEGRKHLGRPWFWLAALIAATLFLPVVLWNQTHDWASFRFQVRHGLGRDTQVVRHVLEYIGGQAALPTPLIFGLMVAAAAQLWRARRGTSLGARVILWAGCTPLVFFLISATRHRVEMNWPAAGYAGLAIIAAAELRCLARRAVREHAARGIRKAL